jgi:hypothetical protein
LVHQWISHTQLSFHPKVTKESAFINECPHCRQITGPLRLGVSVIVAPQNSDFIGMQNVQEKRRVRGDKKLCPLACSTALLAEFWKQPRVKKVLWLLDSDEGRRLRIIKQNKISKHF